MERKPLTAYENLLEKEGDTENEFLYTGEQYNANSGLYYLRARYMDPSTGTFISMDSYQGSIYDAVSLHKYLYANANPVMYTDPSGYFSLSERCSRVLLWDMVDGMCKTSLAIILKPMMAIFGLAGQVDQIQEALESGDPAEIAVRFVQLICMLFGLTSQCFTGDTLVSTEFGLRPIEEIEVGDYVWSENTETGEKELRKVLSVSVTETDVLIHVTTENGTKIRTTENHPFYVEGKGWCAAAELETGDLLCTQDGETETVSDVVAEQLEEPVKVYNLEIEDSHTYYVSEDSVLVHNRCKLGENMQSDPNGIGDPGSDYDAHHIFHKNLEPYLKR